MIVRFQHRDISCTLNTLSGFIHIEEPGRERTVPLMNASEDLRKAAVSAKVALLRYRAGQFNPLDLQGKHNVEIIEEAARYGATPEDVIAVDSIQLEQSKSAAD